MPARLPPADKLTHYALGTLIVAALLPFGWTWAVLVLVLCAIGREVYGWRARGRTMTRDNWMESAKDIAWTLAGGGVVLAPYLMLLESLA